MKDFELSPEEFQRLLKEIKTLANEEDDRRHVILETTSMPAVNPTGPPPAPAKSSANASCETMSIGHESSVIMIRPRQIPEASKHWAEWITRPERQSGKLAVGYLLTALAALLGIGAIALYSLLSNPQGGTPGALIMALLAGLGGLIHSLFRYAKRLRAPHALKALKKDRRPPLLLLRAFRDDFHELHGYSSQGGLLTFGQGGSKTFEEFLYDSLSLVGPVIAIGRPGERTPPLGASRFWVRDWQPVVDEILREAQYAVLIMGNLSLAGEDGLTWEVKKLFSLEDYQKVILVMPPIDEVQVAQRWRQYQQLSHGRIPTYQGGEIAAAFDANGKCRIARVEKRGWFTKTYKRDLFAYQFFIQIRKG